jgi:hypothetical protein
VLVEKIVTMLNEAQATSDGPAAKLWRAALATDIRRIGGNYAAGEHVRPDDDVAIRTMFEEVKMWLAGRYRRYPIEITTLYPSIVLEVTTADNVFTYADGTIEIGVGTSRSKMEYYSWLLHELRHAVYPVWQAIAPDPSQVKVDEGTVLEGSGVAAEALLLPLFLRSALGSDKALALYALDFAIRDARFAGTTDATLQIYFRTGCSGHGDLNTIGFAKRIAESYGLTGKLADNAAIRAHAGTQYLQYIWSGLQVLEDIGWLQKEIDPTGERLVDPYVLFACGLNTPRREASFVSALKDCMSH